MTLTALIQSIEGPFPIAPVLDLIKKHALGGVFVQGSRPNYQEIVNMVKEAADYPILIMTDAERGIAPYQIGSQNAIGRTGRAELACPLFCAVHFPRPAERVCGFEFFGDAKLFYQPGEDEVDLPLCFLLAFIEMLIEPTRGQKRGISASAVLFEIVEAHPAVLADGVIGLLWESQVGIENTVFLAVGAAEFFKFVLHLKLPPCSAFCQRCWLLFCLRFAGRERRY